ncbi:Crp/Fnr family transcriptional regulator [Hyphomicrobium methylovorum]|uniref:Crp/Fnr family transcriptional regulator n=1 Tax=Hyphomicrobium methylovorum TaxID=84 RepID=UPI0015E792A5|nr:Crp/Fnr family transcriptional regulator [Hyphomicrobium methylovorum]MBA2126761.1 Crp/Fnr family transcriptional regulator [Hyphomicrobium methylovorum]
MTGQGNTKKSARGRAAARESQQTPCVKCPLRKLACFCDVSQDELDFIQWMKSGELVADQGTTVLMEGHSSPHLYTILSGWAFRFKSLPDGRRQILNFALPGDFLGLQTSMFNEMQHSVETLTNTVMCVFPRDKIWTLYKKFPSLAYDLTWIASRSERLLDEQLLAVGRRSALERIAFVLQHLASRAQLLGLGNGNNLALPITQQHLADALGLSLVHTNKTLKILNDRKIIRWKEGSFAILDEKAMRTLSGLEADPLLRPLI